MCIFHFVEDPAEGIHNVVCVHHGMTFNGGGMKRSRLMLCRGGA